MQQGTVEQVDDGDACFSCSSEKNTAQAIVAALVKLPEQTKNRIVYLQDFTSTQQELVAEISRQTGKKFTVTVVNGQELVKRKQAEGSAGDEFANYALVSLAIVSGSRYGTLFGEEYGCEIMTEKLGLRKVTLADEVADALRRLQSNGRQVVISNS